MEWIKCENSHEQDLYVCRPVTGLLTYYCFVVYNRTDMQRHQKMDNWNSSFSIYSSDKCIKRESIPVPETFEDINAYCLDYANNLV